MFERQTTDSSHEFTDQRHIHILATPLDEMLQIDWVSLHYLVEFHIDMGAHGLTILGEAAKLSVDERKQW